MDELTIRRTSDQDLDAIIDLVALGLGEGSAPRTREYWSWKHRASPFGTSYLLVAESEGALVGLRAFQRWTWWSSGRPIPAVRAVDTVTHPDWRGRRIFTRLTLEMVDQVRSEGAAFVFNTPNERSRPGYLKMGWTQVGRLMPWLLPRRPRRLARRSSGSRSELAEGTFSPVPELLEVDGFDDVFAGGDPDPRLTTRMDREYLRWRYADIPGFRYYAAWRIQGGDGVAIVFRVVDRPRGVELRLSDIVATPGGAPLRPARALIHDVARRAGADFVTAIAARGTRERRLLMGTGFLPVPRRGPILTVRVLDDGAVPVDPVRLSSWRPSIGSMELF